jgi:hypothetical protein
MKQLYTISAIFLVFILLTGCANKQTDELKGLNDVIPSGWYLSRDPVPTGDERGVLRVQTTSECTRTVVKEPGSEPVNETIKPQIIILFEKKWKAEDYVTADARYEHCLTTTIAESCVKENPTIDTKYNSISIMHWDDCNNETSYVRNLIIGYFKQFETPKNLPVR